MTYTKSVAALLKMLYNGNTDCALAVVSRDGINPIWTHQNCMVSLNVGNYLPIQITDEVYKKIKDHIAIQKTVQKK